jgi:hypothetical protein
LKNEEEMLEENRNFKMCYLRMPRANDSHSLVELYKIGGPRIWNKNHGNFQSQDSVAGNE